MLRSGKKDVYLHRNLVLDSTDGCWGRAKMGTQCDSATLPDAVNPFS